MSVEGGCACGQVRYACLKPPTSGVYCHCVDCRRASGAPMMAWVEVEAEQFSITSGKLDIWQSSKNVKRSYCQHCKTPLIFDYQYYDVRDFGVALYTLDDPSIVKVSAHVWTRSMVVDINDHMQHHKKCTPFFAQQIEAARIQFEKTD